MLVCQQHGVIQGFESQTQLPLEDAFQLCFGGGMQEGVLRHPWAVGQFLFVSCAGCSHECVWLVQVAPGG